MGRLGVATPASAATCFDQAPAALTTSWQATAPRSVSTWVSRSPERRSPVTRAKVRTLTPMASAWVA